jgi:hypothetical protein
MKGFDNIFARRAEALTNRVVGTSANATYLPPLGQPGAGIPVRFGLAAPGARTLRESEGRDEMSLDDSVGSILASDLGDARPVKYGRIRLSDSDDEWTIVESPSRNAGVWDLIVRRGSRQQIGLPRNGT